MNGSALWLIHAAVKTPRGNGEKGQIDDTFPKTGKYRKDFFHLLLEWLRQAWWLYLRSACFDALSRSGMVT